MFSFVALARASSPDLSSKSLTVRAKPTKGASGRASAARTCATQAKDAAPTATRTARRRTGVGRCAIGRAHARTAVSLPQTAASSGMFEIVSNISGPSSSAQADKRGHGDARDRRQKSPVFKLDRVVFPGGKPQSQFARSVFSNDVEARAQGGDAHTDIARRCLLDRAKSLVVDTVLRAQNA